MKKRFGILTGGGDVPPLNLVLSTVWNECQKRDYELLGFIKGWEGLLQNCYVDFKSLKFDPLIGGTILKSSRINLVNIENVKSIILDNINHLGIDGLIVIGGEDTLSNILLLSDVPIVGVAKTIDNDVGLIGENSEIINQFTLGYPTAVEKISRLVSLKYGLRTTAYSHERIIIVESMGMHAGWLALASSLGNPDFIIIPEIPLDYPALLEKIKSIYKSQRHVVGVIAEGAKWGNGNYLAADDTHKDAFGHPKFIGAASVLQELLKRELKEICPNINAVNPSYLYRSGQPNRLDQAAARIAGKTAIKVLEKGIDKPVLLMNTFDKNRSSLKYFNFPLFSITSIDKIHRFVPSDFYDPFSFKATRLAINYLRQVSNELEQDMYNLEAITY